MYYTYIIRCGDNSLYTGITNDVARRMDEHFNKKPAGAKYTKSHGAVRLEALWECESRSCALKLEARIKRLSKERKERLAAGGELSELGAEFSGGVYRRVADLSISAS